MEERAPQRRRRRLLMGLKGAVLLLALAAGAAVLYVAWLIPFTPDIDDLRAARAIRPSVVLSADGVRLATFRQSRRQWIGLGRVSPNVVSALLATEDHRFYQHHGVDIGRTVSAFLRTLGGDPQGGSTLTQQLARNLFPEQIGRSRTLDRKLKEMVTAMRIERAYAKNEILETYLNTVPFLYNVFGIEMASRTYFGKSAADLDVLESATLIGMLKGTVYYNPVVNPERALKRRNTVLAQMVKHGVLADDRFRSLREQPLRINFNRPGDPPGPAPHFAEHLRKWLIAWADEHDYDVDSDGLVVHTTLDSRLQQAAAEAVARQTELLQAVADVEWAKKSPPLPSSNPDAYARMRSRAHPFGYFWASHGELEDEFVRDSQAYRYERARGLGDGDALRHLRADRGFMERLHAAKTTLQAGFVAIDPDTREVKAWIGSRDFSADQFDHVAQATRQPGSTFKPIVYGAALERGMSPDRLYQDGPVRIRLADGSMWRPSDMSGASGEPMTMREGLIYSKNTITAQVMQDVGLESVVSLARAVGINESRLDPVPSLALGTSPVTLLELVSAYCTIADLGEYREPVLVTSIADGTGKVVARFAPQLTRAMSEQTAVELIDMMRGVVRQGTGTGIRARFGITADVAGKTGTTQNNTDGWFVLMHPQLVAGAWVGFNDTRVALRSNYWGQGGHSALRVVGDFFSAALKHELINAAARFPRPLPRPTLTMEPDPEQPPLAEPPPEEPPAGEIIRRWTTPAPGDVVAPGDDEDALPAPAIYSKQDIERMLAEYAERDKARRADGTGPAGRSGTPDGLSSPGRSE